MNGTAERPADPRTPAERERARVSIEFRDADLRTVLDLVARAGGYRVLFEPDVKGRVAVSAVDRPWREVFLDVLRRARLESVEHDDLILVSPAGRRSRTGTR
jgi:type II secretory pathway component GspD/PulD (secretin)